MPAELINGKDLIQGAIILVGALAWNESAKKFISYVLPVNENGARKNVFYATLIYSIFVTIALLCIMQAYNFTSSRINAATGRTRADSGPRGMTAGFAHLPR